MFGPIAAEMLGAGRRVQAADPGQRQFAAAANFPPGSEKRPESVGVSPPLRGDFMGYAAFGGAL